MRRRAAPRAQGGVAAVAAMAALGALLGACDDAAPPIDPPAPRWVYPPGPHPVAALGALRGRFGRDRAPAPALAAGVIGDTGRPLQRAAAFAVPGAGAARAILHGFDGGQPSIELVDVDAGRALWRRGDCATVAGVSADVTLCAGGGELRAIGHDGQPRWRRPGAPRAVTEERVVIDGAGEVIVLGAADGAERARVRLPRGVAVEDVLASCGDAGRELFARGAGGRLVRIADGAGGPAIAWAAPVGLGPIVAVDACDGEIVRARVQAAPDTALVAIARATGRITGRVDGVRGVWRARDGSDALEIASAAGVARWSRDLAGAPVLLPLPPLGELIAERGDARLVRATALTAVLLDRGGVRSYLPFAWPSGVLGVLGAGAAAVLAAPGDRASGQLPRRLGLSARPREALWLPRSGPVAPPAELRDLPPPAPVDLAAAAIARPDAAARGVGGAALDPADPAALYAITLEGDAGGDRPAGLASVDLARRAWRWWRPDGCGAGEPVAVAVARDVVVCAAGGAGGAGGAVIATGKDGAPRWRWEGADVSGVDGVDDLGAAGDAVLVHTADRIWVLDAATGAPRGQITSDDGAPARAAAVAVGETTYVAAYERGRLVARLPAAGMLPVWSLAVDGVIRAISPSLGGVLVELEGGDAYRIELATAAVAPIAGVGLTWRAAGDLITGEATGGPIPGPTTEAAPRRPAPVAPPRRPSPSDDDGPPMWTPIPPPPSLGDSLQLALYEPAGGLVGRNDYPLSPPIAPAFARGPAGSPIVVAAGPGLREVLVIDPRDGSPVRRIALPDGAAARLLFGTVVAGRPVAGLLLAAPLRVVLL